MENFLKQNTPIELPKKQSQTTCSTRTTVHRLDIRLQELFDKHCWKIVKCMPAERFTINSWWHLFFFLICLEKQNFSISIRIGESILLKVKCLRRIYEKFQGFDTLQKGKSFLKFEWTYLMPVIRSSEVNSSEINSSVSEFWIMNAKEISAIMSCVQCLRHMWCWTDFFLCGKL